MENLANIFPCRNPRNPKMADPYQRKATFTNWPSQVIRAPVDELVEAGFIYLNEGDKLKCFYCNGGLQHWQYDENPWFEHAKWYPNCEYLLRKKGISYVQHVAEQFPLLRRPVFQQYPQPISRPPCALSSHSSIPSTSSSIVAADEIPESSSEQPSVVHKSKLEKAMNSYIVKEALRLAFDRNLVSRVVKRKLGLNEEYQTMLELVGDLQTAEADPSYLNADEEEEANFYEEPAEKLEVMAQAPQNFSSSPTNSADYSSSGLVEENNDCAAIKCKIEDIKNEQTCKVCLDRISDCVFIPCGHVCCCVTCGSALRKCPICRKDLEKIIKFYW